MFGFECFNRNGLEQLIINTLNEQMQYHYNQRIFISEMLEMEAEDIDTINLNFYDNKTALDNLLTKPDGLFYIIDDASRSCQDQDLIMGTPCQPRDPLDSTLSFRQIACPRSTASS